MNPHRLEIDLSGRVALVTGSSTGIGRALALTFAAHGARVAVHDRDDVARSEAVADQIRKAGGTAAATTGDLAESSTEKSLIDFARHRLGDVDILVVNASIQFRRPMTEITTDECDTQLAVNVRSTLQLMQRAVPGMIARGWGRILAIGSVQQHRPHAEMAIYSATKSAQLSLVRNLARQVAGSGVTVNNLAPGVIATDRNRDVLADTARVERVVRSIPAGRIGTPSDCAGAALLLCSDAGSYITGADLIVDGGMSL